MFQNRAEAARQLIERLRGRALTDPLVLGIPRGGMVTASLLAEGLGAECDIVLARKVAAPQNPELAIGAVSEHGEVYFNETEAEFPPLSDASVHAECQRELEEIARRKKLFRAVRQAAPIVGRTVIVSDDGIATGATMIAALQAVAMQHPLRLIVAVPVAPPDRLREVRRWCDEAICLHTPQFFYAVGQFYEEFEPITDEEVVELLRRASRGSTAVTD